MTPMLLTTAPWVHAFVDNHVNARTGAKPPLLSAQFTARSAGLAEPHRRVRCQAGVAGRAIRAFSVQFAPRTIVKKGRLFQKFNLRVR